mmetsp:Transcript_23967/g.43814  ORF Transcript_23967/g.43814 Transcript_23967/m.43814 type:complete len:90 (+) Transcript_23967:3698-3967(+)
MLSFGRFNRRMKTRINLGVAAELLAVFGSRLEKKKQTGSLPKSTACQRSQNTLQARPRRDAPQQLNSRYGQTAVFAFCDKTGVAQFLRR